MTEAVWIALITQAGALLTAVIVALIQSRRLRDEKATSREDRELAEQTIDAQKAEIHLRSRSPSSRCSGTDSVPAATGSIVPGGEPG